ncbi:MAG: hypothetical protein CTY39_03765 [Hyphomicrobium sp.]|nr:MAG: hypothetical protein CTY39_03765 [Hyphomicrobium sp.]
MTLPSPEPETRAHQALALIAPSVAKIKRLPKFIEGLRSDQLRYLSQSSRLEEGRNPALIQLAALMASISVLGFVVWAAATNIVEVARSPGQVIPFGYEQTVQHMDGGVVSNIMVAEGEQVEKGQTLVRIEGNGIKQDLEQARQKQWSLEISAERLRAFVEQRQPDFSKFGHPQDAKIQEQARFFNAAASALSGQEDVIRKQIAQKQEQLAILARQTETETANLATIGKLHDSRKELHKKGLLQFSILAQTMTQFASQEGQVANLKQEMVQAQQAISEYELRLTALLASSRDQKNQELHTELSEIAQNAEQIKKLEERLARLDVKSPITGIVKGISVNTIGAVLKSGEALMSIVPTEGELVVETQIEPRHIGNVQSGQPVRVRISSYDFARYGVVMGTLEHISATTFTDPKGDPYYKGRVRLSNMYLDPVHKKQEILPGMTIMAEIVTGEKSILEYLLKPLRNAVDSAMSET